MPRIHNAEDPSAPGRQNTAAKSRGWVFTENDPGSVAMWRARLGLPVPYAPDGLGGGGGGGPSEGGSPFPGCVRYCICQLEEGEQGLHRHLQGYVELKSQQRLSWLKQHLSSTAHFEPRRGSRDQARDYCRKPDTRVDGPWEYGDWQSGGQGSRCDLQDVAKKIKEGSSVREIAEAYPVDFIRYHRGIKELHTLLTSKVRDPENPHRVIVMLGPPGCGKSHLTTRLFPGAYWKPSGDKWWNDYNGEATVVFDDLNSGWFTMDEWKRVLDRNNYMGQTKGGYVALANTTSVITSNTLPHPYRDWETDRKSTRLNSSHRL